MAEHEDPTGQRLCGYRGCRALLPPSSGPGNKAKYCQDGRTWGPRQLSCKQAAIALEHTASLAGPVALPDASVTELGERIAAALIPAQALVAALAEVRRELDSTVTAAQRDRDAALAEAAEQRGLRAAAEQRAAAAEQRADVADEAATAAARGRADAEAERDHAVEARRVAERAQQRAEARLDDARDAVRRAEQRAEAAGHRVHQLDHELAAGTAELTALRAALEEERRRGHSAAERANTLVREHEAALRELWHAHETRVDQLRAQHTAALAAARREAAEMLDQARRDAAAELADLHRQVGELVRQVTAVRTLLAEDPAGPRAEDPAEPVPGAVLSPGTPER